MQSSVGERTHPREQGLNSGCILKADLKNLLAGHVRDVGETGYGCTREGSSSAACGTGSGGSVARDGGGSCPAPRARGVPAAAPRRADLPLQPGRPAWVCVAWGTRARHGLSSVSCAERPPPSAANASLPRAGRPATSRCSRGGTQNPRRGPNVRGQQRGLPQVTPRFWPET